MIPHAMPSPTVDGDELVVRLSGWERAAVWRRRPAVLVELEPPSEFGRLLVTVADPAATVATVRAAARS
jgi:hypothetical protein